MTLSNEARIMIGLLLITLPTVEFGGYFLLSQLGRKDGAIRTALQGSYYRAMHAHAGVLILLAMIAQMMIDVAGFSTPLAWAVRIGFAAAPILIPAGFAFSAPAPDATRPKRPVVLIYAGAILLAVSLVVLALGLLFGG